MFGGSFEAEGFFDGGFSEVDLQPHVVSAAGEVCGGVSAPLQVQLTASSGTWGGRSTTLVGVVANPLPMPEYESEITPTFESDNWSCTGWGTATITCDVTLTSSIDLNECAIDTLFNMLGCPVPVPGSGTFFVPTTRYAGLTGEVFYAPSFEMNTVPIPVGDWVNKSLGLVDAAPGYTVQAQVCLDGVCTTRTTPSF